MPTRKTDVTGLTTLPTAADDHPQPSREPRPGLILASRPPGLLSDDRAPIDQGLTVGRSSSCGWCIKDHRLSRAHFTLSPGPRGSALIRDLKSRNGSYLDGHRLEEQRYIPPGTVIRAGSCVFVLVEDLSALSPPGSVDPTGQMAGRFYAGAILHRLRVAARTGRHVLLEGESGVGKELAARCLHGLYSEGSRRGGLHAQNAACFAGEDDAIGGLFGVTRGAFTGVEARAGAIELAQGGTLFLDEVHALPLRVQRSLLRFVEDGLLTPLGQSGPGRRAADLRLILGTNLPVDEACATEQLAHDLVARLHRVSLPPLRERRADIPSIFADVLRGTLDGPAASATLDLLSAPLMERLCLHDYQRGNVRELIDIAAVIGARLAEGEPADLALSGALDEALGPSHGKPAPSIAGPDLEGLGGSHYDRHQGEIIALYKAVGGNLSQLEQALKGEGIECTRRWLAEYLDRWGVRAIRRRGGGKDEGPGDEV